MAVTIDGVTGGYGDHHQREAEYSAGIYRQFKDQLPGNKRAFELAAGIGRVTKYLLHDEFEEIDINEQSPVQIARAKIECPYVKK